MPRNARDNVEGKNSLHTVCPYAVLLRPWIKGEVAGDHLPIYFNGWANANYSINTCLGFPGLIHCMDFAWKNADTLIFILLFIIRPSSRVSLSFIAHLRRHVRTSDAWRKIFFSLLPGRSCIRSLSLLPSDVQKTCAWAQALFRFRKRIFPEFHNVRKFLRVDQSIEW